MSKRLTQEQLEAIRTRAKYSISGKRIAGVVVSEDIPALLAEVEHYSGKISFYLDEIERKIMEVIRNE